MKRPSMTIYPGDFSDRAYRSLSLAARGLWLDCIFIAHEGEPYGSLIINGRPVTVDDLPRQVGASTKTVRAAAAELIEKGIPTVWRDPVQFLAEVRLESTYWLKPIGSEGAARVQLSLFESMRERAKDRTGQPVENPVEILWKPVEIPSPTTHPSRHQVGPHLALIPPTMSAASLLQTWWIRRQVRDEEKRRNLKKAGSLGGNPRLK